MITIDYDEQMKKDKRNIEIFYKYDHGKRIIDAILQNRPKEEESTAE